MQIQKNISLKAFNTFGIDVRAKSFVAVKTARLLREVIQSKTLGDNLFILGGGSNVLFTKDFDGMIIHSELKGIRVIEENDEHVIVQAESGEKWAEFVDYTIEHHWGGLENLSLIPGSVGAAPVQNIGAYGTEQEKTFVSLEAMNLSTGKIHTFTHNICNFAYRNSIFKTLEKGKWFILNVNYRLQKNPKVSLKYKALKEYFRGKDTSFITIKAVSKAVKEIRRSKLPDPKVLGNGGSFFKNPVIEKETFLPLQKRFPEIPFYELADDKIKLAAGWLIEQAGWKGKNIGQAAVHNKQALVLVNLGNASGTDIMNLAYTIQADVLSRFNIHLESEVLIL